MIRLASVFNRKARLWTKGRKELFKIIEQEISPDEKKIWFHASSLGEFEQGRPLIEYIRKNHPGMKIVLTFFSPSGYEIRKDYGGAHHVIYLPADTRRNARKFIAAINPEKVFFIKYEFWYHYLATLYQKQVSTYLVSAIFREDQIFFKSYGRWFVKMLVMFEHIFVQDEKSASLLKKLNVNSYTVAGDTRFDRVHEIASRAKEISLVNEFVKGCTILVAGSTWPKDEELLISFINSTANKDVKLIIAPHEIHEAHVDNILKMVKRRAARFSQANENNISQYEVLIIDNIGMLSSLYKYGDIAYIGGGFGKGIHNILEPATFGLPVIFGPNYRKFREAVILKQKGGAFVINDYEEVKDVFDRLIKDKVFYQDTSGIAKKYVLENRGATKMIMDKCHLQISGN